MPPLLFQTEHVQTRESQVHGEPGPQSPRPRHHHLQARGQQPAVDSRQGGCFGRHRLRPNHRHQGDHIQDSLDVRVRDGDPGPQSPRPRHHHLRAQGQHSAVDSGQGGCFGCHRLRPSHGNFSHMHLKGITTLLEGNHCKIYFNNKSFL